MSTLQLEEVPLDQLKPHPRNYRSHPDDEIEHLMESIKANGIYRNVVIAQDGTVLAGHGVVQASMKLGIQSIPVYRTPYGSDDPRALKLIISDNEISHLAADDDRVLTELLKELKDADIDLLGTGYDEMMLANLVMVTRPAAEIADFDEAAEWVGMPEYAVEGERSEKFSVIVNFVAEDDCKEFCRRLGLESTPILTAKVRKSLWWPTPLEKDDVRSVRFTDSGNEHEDE